jgi:protease-4
MSTMSRFFGAIGRGFALARAFVANLLFVIFIVLVLALLFSGEAPVSVPSGAALLVAPKGAIVEQLSQTSPLGGLLGGEVMSETLLRDVTEALEHAATDERIKVVVLDLDELTDVSPAHLAAVGSALDDVKTAGKSVIALGDYFSQAQYYLASFANEVYMHPMGQVLLTGYGAYQSYYHDLLDKLKVNVHVFRVGTYKEAVEPYTRADMSAEAKEANRTLLTALWGDYAKRITTNRKLADGALDEYVAKYDSLLAGAQGDMARVALDRGLVDALLSREDMRKRLIEDVGEEDGDYRHIDANAYLTAVRPRVAPTTNADVGVIVAKGLILMGDQPRGTIGSDTYAKLIRQAREDSGVRALVIRIDSPGGAAFASELIRQELELTQQAGKPVVASMGGVAASGGYWIASTSDEIWASPETITGSIGIFGIVPTFEESLRSVGVTRDGVGTSDLSGALDPFGGLRPQMATILQANVENGYRRFLALVAKGRDMAPEDVDRIGQGRVWSGDRAKEIGLVDDLGQLSDAIAAAAHRAGLEKYGVRYIEKPLSAQEQLFRQLADSLGLAPPAPVGRVIGQAMDALAMLRSLNDPMGLYGLCESCDIAP